MTNDEIKKWGTERQVKGYYATYVLHNWKKKTLTAVLRATEQEAELQSSSQIKIVKD